MLVRECLCSDPIGQFKSERLQGFTTSSDLLVNVTPIVLRGGLLFS